MELKAIISKALMQSISAEDYQNILTQYAEEGKTSGQQKEDLIHYTKLNAQRSKRVSKTMEINAELTELIQEIKQPTKWLLITETWCGDAASSVPAISKLLESNLNIDLRIVFRDENPELMDQFLTNGGKSIPKLIAMNPALNVLFTWGPRPSALQKIYDEWRFSEPSEKPPYKEFQVDIQKWYNQNKGKDLQEELVKLLQQNIVTS